MGAGAAGLAAGGRLGRRVLDFVRHFARRFLEFLDALAQTAGKFRDFLGAEQNQNGHQDDDQFRAAKCPDANNVFINFVEP